MNISTSVSQTKHEILLEIHKTRFPSQLETFDVCACLYLARYGFFCVYVLIKTLQRKTPLKLLHGKKILQNIF